MLNNPTMTEKDFIDALKSKQAEIDSLMRRKLPVIVGRMAKDHYQAGFRQGGFLNHGLQLLWAQKTA